MDDEAKKDEPRSDIPARAGRTVRHLQINELEDAQEATLQARFERFCELAVDRLSEVHPRSHEPMLEAGKAKAEFTLKVTITRTSDDVAVAFTVDHEVKSAFPAMPGRPRSARLVPGVGLAQPTTNRQNGLFPPKAPPAE